MRRTFIPLALACWIVASVAGAELSQTYKDWPNGAAGFLLTDSERSAYAQIQTDAGGEHSSGHGVSPDCLVFSVQQVGDSENERAVLVDSPVCKHIEDNEIVEQTLMIVFCIYP